MNDFERDLSSKWVKRYEGVCPRDSQTTVINFSILKRRKGAKILVNVSQTTSTNNNL